MAQVGQGRIRMILWFARSVFLVASHDECIPLDADDKVKKMYWMTLEIWTVFMYFKEVRYIIISIVVV
jgi:hypothetical protein